MSETKDISAMSPEELQGAVQSILANPAFAKLAAEVSGGTASAQPQDTQSTPASAPAMPQISPEMLAKLPQMMSAMAPLLSGRQGKGDGGKGGKDDGNKDGDAERRKRLLAALKPYLSSQRKDAIDSILKVTEMTDLLGQLGSKSSAKDDGQK